MYRQPEQVEVLQEIVVDDNIQPQPQHSAQLMRSIPASFVMQQQNLQASSLVRYQQQQLPIVVRYQQQQPPITVRYQQQLSPSLVRYRQQQSPNVVPVRYQQQSFIQQQQNLIHAQEQRYVVNPQHQQYVVSPQQQQYVIYPQQNNTVQYQSANQLQQQSVSSPAIIRFAMPTPAGLSNSTSSPVMDHSSVFTSSEIASPQSSLSSLGCTPLGPSPELDRSAAGRAKPSAARKLISAAAGQSLLRSMIRPTASPSTTLILRPPATLPSRPGFRLPAPAPPSPSPGCSRWGNQ